MKYIWFVFCILHFILLVSAAIHNKPSAEIDSLLIWTLLCGILFRIEVLAGKSNVRR